MFQNNKVLSPNKSYDEIAKSMNNKLKQSKNETFGALKETDDELKLPWWASFEICGYADYFEWIYEDGDD